MKEMMIDDKKVTERILMKISDGVRNNPMEALNVEKTAEQMVVNID